MKTNDEARTIINNATDKTGDFHGYECPFIRKDEMQKAFKNMRVFPMYAQTENGRKFNEIKSKENECYVSIKSNKNYGNNSTKKSFISFDDSLKGYVPMGDLLESMTLFGCTEINRRPSIEFIQWDSKFLMLVKSANFIGDFKAFVEKDIVFSLFGIEV